MVGSAQTAGSVVALERSVKGARRAFRSSASVGRECFGAKI